MKSERLLSLMILLANRQQVSASELAKRYGVSVRTIYRDIETLSLSGVPIVTETGRLGGISLVEDFKIDRNVVKPAELSHVLSGLQGLATVVPDAALQESLEKYRNLLPRPSAPGASAAPKPLELHMELTPSRRERDTILAIRQAAGLGRLLQIDYADGNGRLTRRTIEAYALVFQWSAWFVYAWCRLRSQYRMFKITRIRGLEQLGERFASRQPDLAARPWTKDWDNESPQETLLRFRPESRLLVLEHFDEAMVCQEADGSLTVRAFFPIGDWAVTFLAGFGGQLEVLSPPELRQRMQDFASGILARYVTASTRPPEIPEIPPNTDIS